MVVVHLSFNVFVGVPLNIYLLFGQTENGGILKDIFYCLEQL